MKHRLSRALFSILALSTTLIGQVVNGPTTTVQNTIAGFESNRKLNNSPLSFDANGNVFLRGTTGTFIAPSLTTVQRNALSPTNGMVIYNQTTAKLQTYEAGAWTDVVGTGGGGGVAAIPEANTVFISYVNGSDATGTRGRQDKPFKTLEAGLAAVQNGDLVKLAPETWQVGSSADVDGEADALTTAIGLYSKTNVTIMGYGATIAGTNYGNIFTVQNCSNTAFYGLTFTGSRDGFVAGQNWICAAVNHRMTNDVTIFQDCTFRDIPDQAISHIGDTLGRPSTRWSIRDCQFLRVGWLQSAHPDIGIFDGATVSGRPRQLIYVGNRITDCAYGVELDGGGALSPASDLFGQSVISGNNFESVLFTGVVINGELGRLVRDVTIAGNHFEFSTNHHVLGGSALVALEGCENVNVTGNTFRGQLVNNADKLYGVEFSFFNIGNPTVNSNILIANNLFEGMAYGVGAPLTATGSSWQSGVTIQGNRFRTQGEAGIHFAGRNLVIKDNVFNMMGKAVGASYPWAIWLYDFDSPGGLENVLVEGNIVDDDASPPTTQRMLTISTAATSPSGTVKIQNNYLIRYLGTAPYSLGSTSYGPPLSSIPLVNVADMGSVPGTSDSSTAIRAAINSFSPAKGGVVYAGDQYSFNVTITNQNIRLVGGGACRDESLGVFTNYWRPYDVTRPVITVGDGSYPVPGIVIQDATIYGLQGTPARMGVHWATAREGSMRNVAIWRFATNLLFQASGSTYEVTRISVQDCVFRMPSGINDAAAIMVAHPSGNNGNHYTTGISLDHCRVLAGQVNNTNFWGIKLYNTALKVNDLYVDNWPNGRALFMGNLSGSSGTPTFEAAGGCFFDDSGASSNPQVWASHTSSQAPTEYLKGNISLTPGIIDTAAGGATYDIRSIARMFLGYYAMAQEPVFIDGFYIYRPGAGHPFQSNGSGPTNCFMGYKGSTTVYIENGDGPIDLRTPDGVTVNGAPIAPTGGDVIGPSSSTANQIMRHRDTSGKVATNSLPTIDDTGVLAGVLRVNYGIGNPNVVDLGTISGGGTATLLVTNQVYRATFSGPTATIALPGSPYNSSMLIIGRCTYNGGDQIITVPSIIRPEVDPDTAVTTFTNAASSGSLFLAQFLADNGSWSILNVNGDKYVPAASGSVDDTVYGAGWNGSMSLAPSQNAVYDKMEAMAPLASPALTGNPTAPTAATADNDTSLATTAFVQQEIVTYIDNTAVGGTWNGVTTDAPSKDVLHDYFLLFDADLDGGVSLIENSASDFTFSTAGNMGLNTTDEQLVFHSAADGQISGEVALSLIQHKTWSFDPKAVCDGAVDRLFLMTVDQDAPEGIHITKWSVSFEADPTTEVDLDLKYADAFIGVANSAVIDILDTTNGASSEDTDANINGGNVIPNGKVLYLEFGTAYAETTHQIIFELYYYAEED